MDKLPSEKEAGRLLEEAHAMNPGPWREHSALVARCAERIAARCPGLDPEKAYVLGLLHDIGRRAGRCNLRHVIEGYRFLTALGYPGAAKIAVTHSFSVKGMDMYMGVIDVPEEDYREIEALVRGFEYDDYDRLIQLCDSLGMADGTIDLTTRMDEIEARYGFYPAAKREMHHRLKAYFDGLAGTDLYPVLRTGEFHP